MGLNGAGSPPTDGSKKDGNKPPVPKPYVETPEIIEFLDKQKPLKFKISARRPKNLEKLLHEPKELSRIAKKSIFLVNTEDVTDEVARANDRKSMEQKIDHALIKALNFGTEEAVASIEDKLKELRNHNITASFNDLSKQYPELMKNLEKKGVYEFYSNAKEAAQIMLYDKIDLDTHGHTLPLSPKTELIVLNPDNLSPSNSYDLFFGRMENGTPARKFPGTIEDMSAITLLHELEHNATLSSVEHKPYFKALIDDAEAEGIKLDKTLYTENMVHHAGEIDADLSMIKNGEKLISQASMEWFINGRFARHGYNQIRGRMVDNESYELSEHDTAAFVKDYISTGKVPDYLSTRRALLSFYNKTAEACLGDFRSNLRKDLNTRFSDVSLNVMTNAVKKGLEQEPPLYNEREADIAGHFMDAMEQLNIEPKTIVANEIRNAPDTAPSPDITPKM